jgi:adenosylmethionine-8-amino-7-oxononanoate aminotransferase
MSDYRDFPPLEVVAAQGCRLRLADGRELLDAISSWWCRSLGHQHPRLVAALKNQADRFSQVILANTTNEQAVRFCERILAVANGYGPDVWGPDAAPGRQPGWFGKVFLADNGSTAVEIALKIALHAHRHRGNIRRTRFAALADGYHGETVGALSVGDCGLYADPYRPLLFGCLQLGPLPLRAGPHDPRWQDASAEWPAIQAQLDAQADELAAIIYEPVLQGAGGMRLYSPDLLRRLRAWADAHDVYLIADEIAAGMGRCGRMLAGEHAGIRPDFAVMSKGLTGGELPLSCVLVPDHIHDLFLGERKRAFLHSNTWSGNALALAVANAVLDEFAESDVLGHVARTGPDLLAGLEKLAATRPYLRNVRGIGMMAAVDLCRPDGTPCDPAARTGWRVFRAAVERGALLRPLGDTMYVLPPLNTSAEDCAAMVAVLAVACDAVLGA